MSRCAMPLILARQSMALVLACTLALCGCRRSAKAHRKGVLVVSGDTAGWITPCGCTSNQSGGLARRGQYLRHLRSDSAVVYVDAGGAAAGVSEYHRLKFEAILRGELAMLIAAHNLGAAELALGAAYIRQTAAALGVPFISANARDGDGKRLVDAMRLVILGERRLAVVGVVSQRYASAAIRIDDPRAAVLSAIADKRGQFDSLVILAYLPEDELAELASAIPEADAVIGGPTGQPIAPRRSGPTLLTSATNMGKFLVRVDADGPAGRWPASIVELNSTIPDDPVQNRNVERYLAELAQRDFPASQTSLVKQLPVASADYRVAGTQSCIACHEADHAKWLASAHAKAWADIQQRGSQVDPFCQQCHTTAYGLPGGFESIAGSAQHVAVGCEACHGPSQAHVKEPKIRTAFLSRNQCVHCHDHENSPKFAEAAYWAKIVHGPATRPTTAAVREVLR